MSSGSSSSTSSPGSSLKSEPPVGGVVRVPDMDDALDAIQRAEHPQEYDELTDRQKRLSSLAWGGWKLPGFGEPLEDCEDLIPESKHFCTDCGKLHHLPRNCMRYDCPAHAGQAIRRRAAGRNSDQPGVVPQLDAIARRLGSYYGERFNYYHLVLSPPDEYVFESDDPLRRAVGIGDYDGVIPEIMDALGIQGLVCAHSHRGDDENHGDGDMGEWRTRLFHERDWRDDVQEELSREPHFHIVGVAPWEPIQDDDETGTLERWEDVADETGWILHAIEGEDGSTVIGSDASNETEQTAAVARAATYALSHSLVYDAGDQRRLGAWMKGPDVGSTTVRPQNHRRVKKIVNQVCEDTLGVIPPSLECDEEIPKELDLGDLEDDTLPHLDRPSQERSPLDPSYHEPLAGFSGPDVATSSAGAPPLDSSTSGAGGNDGVAGMDSPPNELPDGADDLGDGSSAPSSPTPVARDKSSLSDELGEDKSGLCDVLDVDKEDLYAETDQETETCGGHLDHISQAGARLATPDWVQDAPHSEELDGYYRAYVRLMESRDQDPEDGRTEIPELEDDPPPD